MMKFPIYGKIKFHVPNHQPDIQLYIYKYICGISLDGLYLCFNCAYTNPFVRFKIRSETIFHDEYHLSQRDHRMLNIPHSTSHSMALPSGKLT